MGSPFLSRAVRSLRRGLFAAAVLLGLCAVAVPQGAAGQSTCISTADGSFGDSGNWDCGIVPSSNDIAIVDGNNIRFFQGRTVGEVTVRNKGALGPGNDNLLLDVTDDDGQTGNLTLKSGGTLDLDPTFGGTADVSIEGNLSNPSSNSGTLSSSGRTVTFNGGTTQTLSGDFTDSNAFADIIVDGSDVQGSGTQTDLRGSDVTINNDGSFTSAGTVFLGDNPVTFSGGTVIFNGVVDVDGDGNAEALDTGGNELTISSGASLAVGGNLELRASSFTADGTLQLGTDSLQNGETAILSGGKRSYTLTDLATGGDGEFRIQKDLSVSDSLSAPSSSTELSITTDPATNGKNTITLTGSGGTKSVGGSGTIGIGTNFVLDDVTFDPAGKLAFRSTEPGGDTRNAGDIVDGAVRFDNGASFASSPQVFAERQIQNIISGSSGDASSGTFGDNAGWRLISAPVTSQFDNLIEKRDGEQLIIDPTRGAMLYEFDAANQDTDPWSAVTDLTRSFKRGNAYLLFFFDDNLDPISDNGGLTVRTENPATTTSSPVSRTVNPGSDTDIFLFGNPYPSYFDLDQLRDPNASSAFYDADFAQNVQVWETNGVSGDSPNGSYVDYDPSSNDIAPWQGFFIEANSTNQSTLEFQPDGTVFSGLEFRKSEPKAESQTRTMRLELRFEDGSDPPVQLDNQTRFVFQENATTNFDRQDLSKLTPQGAYSYGAIGIEGTKFGNIRYKAIESRPYDPSLPIEMPLGFDASGFSGDFTIRASDFENIPSDWAIQITDTENGKEVILEPGGEGYTFSFDASKSKIASTSSSSGRTPPSPQPILFKRDELETDGAQSKESSSPSRFKVTIDQTEALPVELNGFNGSVEGQDVILEWQTASEQNNAGFEIQRKDTETGQFTNVGYVESKAEGGTSSRSLSYQYRASDLDAGTHTFRLKQVDLDGGTSYSDPIDVTVGLEGSHTLTTYPNPVRDQAMVKFAVKEQARVTVELYNTLGQRVTTLYRDTPPAEQTQRVSLDADGLSSGLYVVRLRSKAVTSTQTVTVVR